MSQGRTISKGRALYDFAGKAEMRQLTFKAGDIINITNQYDNGWWAGELNGTVGYLPATYVQLISTVPVPNGTDSPAAAARVVPSNRPVSAYSPSTNGSSIASAAAAAASASGSRIAPQAPSAASRPALGGSNMGPATPTRPAGLASGGSGFAGSNRPVSAYASSSPATPPAAARPPLPAGGAPPPSLAARKPVGAGPATPPARQPPKQSLPATPIAAAEPARPTRATVRLTNADRGRAATLRPTASEVSSVTDSDIVELDQLISKLQNDVSELKKLM